MFLMYCLQPSPRSSATRTFALAENDAALTGIRMKCLQVLPLRRLLLLGGDDGVVRVSACLQPLN
jgi:hypothetical protein